MTTLLYYTTSWILRKFFQTFLSLANPNLSLAYSILHILFLSLDHSRLHMLYMIHTLDRRLDTFIIGAQDVLYHISIEYQMFHASTKIMWCNFLHRKTNCTLVRWITYIIKSRNTRQLEIFCTKHCHSYKGHNDNSPRHMGYYSMNFSKLARSSFNFPMILSASCLLNTF